MDWDFVVKRERLGRCLAADDDVVHGGERWRRWLVANLGHDRQQRLAEFCKRLLRLPYIEDLEIVFLSKARVVEPALGIPSPAFSRRLITSAYVFAVKLASAKYTLMAILYLLLGS